MAGFVEGWGTVASGHRAAMSWIAILGVIAASLVVLPTAVPSAGAQVSGAEVTHTASCLAGNGRVDTMIINRTGSPATYRLEFEGLSARALLVDAGDWWRMPVTGRPDRSYSVVVKRDGAVISNSSVEVACDANPPQLGGDQLVIFDACRAERGYILFHFINESAQQRSYVIEFDGVPNRSTSAAPYGQAIRAVTGRPDGTYDVRVRSGGEVVHSGVVPVSCAAEQQPPPPIGDLSDVSVISVFGPAPEPEYHTLSMGSRGADVRAMQYLLQKAGHDVATDGLFGGGTDDAVRDFQEARGLNVDGEAGPDTWGELVTGTTVRYGDTGDEVAAVTALLDKWDSAGVVQTFDGEVQDRVAGFQKHWELSIDGVVGPTTWRHLVFQFTQPVRTGPICHGLIGTTDTNNWPRESWGTAATVATLRRGATILDAQHGVRTAVRDLSYERGGLFRIESSGRRQHESHQQGMDVDVRPFTASDAQCSQGLTFRSSIYRWDVTADFVFAYEEASESLGGDQHRLTFFNDQRVIDMVPKVQSQPNHDDHLHVRSCTAFHPESASYRCLNGLAQTVETRSTTRAVATSEQSALFGLDSLDSASSLAYEFVDQFGRLQQVTMTANGGYYLSIHDPQSLFECERGYNPDTNIATRTCRQPLDGEMTQSWYQATGVPSTGTASMKYPDVMPRLYELPEMGVGAGGSATVQLADLHGAEPTIYNVMSVVDEQSGLVTYAEIEGVGAVELASVEVDSISAVALQERILDLERRFATSERSFTSSLDHVELTVRQAWAAHPELMAKVPMAMQSMELAELYVSGQNSADLKLTGVYRKGVWEATATAALSDRDARTALTRSLSWALSEGDAVSASHGTRAIGQVDLHVQSWIGPTGLVADHIAAS